MLDSLWRRLDGKMAALVGIGNPMRGDDGVGVFLASQLQGKLGATVVDAGEVPENYLGVVAAVRPEVVVIVDVAQLGAEPGSTAVIEVEDLVRTGLSTHNANLGLFATMLQHETKADVVVLGIQPSSTAYGAPMSLAVTTTAGLLQELFQRCWPAATISGPEGRTR